MTNVMTYQLTSTIMKYSILKRKNWAIAQSVASILDHRIYYNDTSTNIQGKCLINVQTVARVLVVYPIYNAIKEHTQGRSRISVVIVLNALVISQTYRNIKGYIAGKSLTSAPSVACVLVSRGILNSMRKHTLIREQIQTLFMKSHSNVQNVAKVFCVQQIFKAIKEHTVGRSPITVHSVLNVSLAYHMFTDT